VLRNAGGGRYVFQKNFLIDKAKNFWFKCHRGELCF
jgi:hypothetical protein